MSSGKFKAGDEAWVAAQLAQAQRPQQPVVMYQKWRSLMFLHWQVEPERVQATLPPGLKVDCHEGVAYLGLVPFFMCRVRPRWIPSMGPLSNFLECNVRTYVVDAHGRPGIWFESLECNQALAVWTARRFFHLRYEHARMTAEPDGRGGLDYQVARRDGRMRANFHYTLGESAQPATPGSLDFFLVERYRLFSHSRSGLFTGQVHHPPYGLTTVRLDKLDFHLPPPWDDVGGDPVHITGSQGVDVEIFPLEKCR